MVSKLKFSQGMCYGKDYIIMIIIIVIILIIIILFTGLSCTIYMPLLEEGGFIKLLLIFFKPNNYLWDDVAVDYHVLPNFILFCYVAKCNLGKVNLEPMSPAVSRICGVAAGACFAMCFGI